MRRWIAVDMNRTPNTRLRKTPSNSRQKRTVPQPTARELLHVVLTETVRIGNLARDVLLAELPSGMLFPPSIPSSDGHRITSPEAMFAMRKLSALARKERPAIRNKIDAKAFERQALYAG
jgi:hypothetical protein